MNGYQDQADMTMEWSNSKEEIDKYCSMKLAEETGELSGMIAKHYYHQKNFDKENLIEELGDIMWYVAVLARNNDVSLSTIAAKNIFKLRKRHGESYNPNYYKE